MGTASLISIGNELLCGDIADTNAQLIGGRLHQAGMSVVGVRVVGDEIPAIIAALGQATAEADAVIVTGGLGPTDDDVTRQAVAQFLGVELLLNAGLLETIERFFDGRGIPMPLINARQAHLPAGASVIVNPVGTAPGIRAAIGPRQIFVLPGVQTEALAMFQESVLPSLAGMGRVQAVAVRKVQCFGAGESTIAQRLGNMCLRGRNPRVDCTVHGGRITLRIIAGDPDSDRAAVLADAHVDRIRGLLGELVYDSQGRSLAEVAGSMLTARGLSLAVAESCTGGLVAKLLTDVPGASRYFHCGWVTYSDRTKMDLLRVPAATLDRFGAVSPQVAEAMARGARLAAATDMAVALTGIAGPGGGSAEKPVGLVYISLDQDSGVHTERYCFRGTRDSIRLRAADCALNLIRLQMRV